jgi:hypothetical protein
MPRREEEGRERKKNEHDKDERRDREHHEHEKRERREHEREGSGDDPRAHAMIIERRWLGSPPPTAERYAKALKQWQALPGAVPGPATEVPPPEGPERPDSLPLEQAPKMKGASDEP